MNKQICIIILLLTCRICNAQNLVPNGNFEQYSGCPNSISEFDSALFWFNPTYATPDYFNICSPPPSAAGVPDNEIGSQTPHSGKAYSGVYLWAGINQPEYREYIEVPLLSPLVANQCYHFEMYVNVGEKTQYTTDAIGAYFSDTLITDFSTYTVLPFASQINNASGNMPDYINWTLVEGYFTANGGESFLTIGNFKVDLNTDTMLLDSNALWPQSYFYIDDVSLTLCTTEINEPNDFASSEFYPNPFNDELTLTNKDNELSEIILYDITSRRIFNQSFTNSTTINTAQLSKGIYLYEVRNKNGVIKKGKVVKE